MLRGFDSSKDQSYFLHQVKGSDLTRAIFPLGELTKDQVRSIAHDNKLINADKKDSVGICFIGKNDYNDFISNFLGRKPGVIVDENGIKLGEHEGLMYFTLGQRQGIGIGGVKGRDQSSWYVAHKDQSNNELTVVQGGDNPLLFSEGCYTEDVHWINTELVNGSACEVQIRYQSKPIKATIYKTSKGNKINFHETVSAVTPGQSAVIYQNEECLGGAVIKERISKKYYSWAEDREYNYEVYE